MKPFLPDWIDSAFDNKSGVIELKTFLSRNAGLKVLPGGTLATRDLPAACFKTRVSTSVDQISAARSLATACARLVSRATQPEYKRPPTIADDLRAAALKNSTKPWIDLAALLEACWSSGIPVLYMPTLPVQGRKMEGMVSFLDGRPVIVLTKKVPHPDWLLFILGHEIGHIARSHLPEDEGQAIVDETVEGVFDDRDLQEKEANEYATHLLAPDGQEVKIGNKLPKAAAFADVAIRYGRDHGISPGYVILNAVHNSLVDGKKPYGLGQAALKALPSENKASVAELCREALRRHIDIDVLRDDSIDFLEKLALL
ncbi:hypothetical protein ACC699_24330 [Rhizobium ruizarguesonis]